MSSDRQGLWPLEEDPKANAQHWADPPDPLLMLEEIKQRISYIDTVPFGEKVEKRLGECVVFDDGRPLNPRGRTGMKGRGTLGKWGPNHAADPIVTRFHPVSGKLQFAAVMRKDTGDWAIPGGMVDAGEVATKTLINEFKEEACSDIADPHVNDETGQKVDSSLKPRNDEQEWSASIV